MKIGVNSVCTYVAISGCRMPTLKLQIIYKIGMIHEDGSETKET